MAAPNKKVQVWDEVVRLSGSMSQAQVGEELGVHPYTISKWCREEGFTWPRKKGGRKRGERVSKPCRQCGQQMILPPSQATFREFCSRDCTNAWQRDNRSAFKTCPCGEQIKLQEGATTMYSYRLYCSDECRAKYGKKRQPDPAKQVTFNCGTCGKEVTRWKGYGSTVSGIRFCNNTCAAKHTKTVRHYVVREMDMVLDSGWEMLFAGLCYWHKLEVVRVDRTLAVTTGSGSVYAPDFIVGGSIAVEVKGLDRGNQDEGRELWRETMGPLVVVDRQIMALLMASDSAEEMLDTLGTLDTDPVASVASHQPPRKEQS